MEYVYIVIVLALIEYMVLGGIVGYARGKYGIKAPACTGSAEFERAFRVHMNTLEGLVVFLPGLWFFGLFISPLWAAVIGLVGIVGRALYARGYLADAEKRGIGAMICGLVNMVLLIGSLVGLLIAVI
jgi:glutathione S-transferase